MARIKIIGGSENGVQENYNQYLNFFKGMSALDIVKYLFVGIPILILGFLYLFMAQGDIEKMFNEPLIVGQLLLVLAMPFCYLAMRNICQDLKDRKKRDGLLIPLWILIVYQVSSFNMICSFSHHLWYFPRVW